MTSRWCRPGSASASPGRFLLGRALRLGLGFLLFALRQAGLQRFHEIENLAALLRLGLGGDLLAFDLLLDRLEHPLPHGVMVLLRLEVFGGPLDRKSTRLNSSHGYISYAV